jgi:hypothetical protein
MIPDGVNAVLDRHFAYPCSFEARDFAPHLGHTLVFLITLFCILQIGVIFSKTSFNDMNDSFQNG